ncbi:hypothetical protein C121_37 [Stenotrophomonas phage C121]|uniref:hypothetical protein n=1 Tax=Stenotrophomonas phage C121 TaxID=2914029 RepID=UPI0023299410|nr:hypothetical protein PP752_gp37 [Stenotrophomonas phage C121]UKL14770.1 hypothetical protein C121_37 [Stenotrophomonas phage C121]
MIRSNTVWRYANLAKKILLLEAGLMVLKKAKKDFLWHGRGSFGKKSTYICSAIYDAGWYFHESLSLTKEKRSMCMSVAQHIKCNISRILGNHNFVTTWSRQRLVTDIDRQNYRHLWMDQMIHDYEQELEKIRESQQAVSELA